MSGEYYLILSPQKGKNNRFQSFYILAGCQNDQRMSVPFEELGALRSVLRVG